MNLNIRRASAFAFACGLAAVTASGCGAGQQSQTATQLPAVNGTSGGTQFIALRDVQLLAEQTGAEVPKGESVPLVFVAANQSPDKNAKIVRITSDVGEVKLGGEKEIKALQAVIFGSSEEDGATAESVSDVKTGTATVQLSKPVSSGLTYEFTFEFENAGKATLAVPVSASVDAPRGGAASSEGGGHGEGH